MTTASLRPPGIIEPYFKYVQKTLPTLDPITFDCIWCIAHGYPCTTSPEALKQLKYLNFINTNGKILEPVQRILQFLYPVHYYLPDGAIIASSDYFTISENLALLKKNKELFPLLQDAITRKTALAREEFQQMGFTDSEGNILPAVKSVYYTVTAQKV
jgi:hypothetical protein